MKTKGENTRTRYNMENEGVLQLDYLQRKTKFEFIKYYV